MIPWAAARERDQCGRCGATLREGAPIGLLGGKRLRRCQTCMSELHPDVPVDWNQVEADRAAHAAARGPAAPAATRPGRAHAPLLDGFTPAAAIAQDGLNALLRDTGGIKGVRRVSPQSPRPYADVADHPAVRRAEDNA